MILVRKIRVQMRLANPYPTIDVTMSIANVIPIIF